MNATDPPPGGMHVIGLFSGVGGMELALHQAGVTTKALCEIDPNARAVLTRRFPGIPVFEDVREVTGDRLRDLGADPTRTILTAGFPCQDLSVAGRRAGLDHGERSGLFWEIHRILGEFPAAWVLLENVAGLLSAVCPCPGDGLCVARGLTVRCPGELHTIIGGACDGQCIARHGGAMGAVLGALGERGYGFSYRVLDAQHFGVPQRRRRVFIVGRRSGGPGITAPAQVLLEPEGRAGDLAAGAAPGPVPARRLAACPAEPRGELTVVSALTSSMAGAGGGVDDNTAQGGHLVWRRPSTPEVTMADSDPSPASTSSWFVKARRAGESDPYPETWTAGGVSPTLNAGENHTDIRATTIVTSVLGDITHALTAEGADASEDGTGRGQPIIAFSHTAGLDAQASGQVAPTVLAGNDRMPAVSGHAVVRRLTPLECERLQGFPDGWCDQLSDSARYKAMGNAVAVPVVAWIAHRIVAVEAAFGVLEDGAA